MSCTCSCNSFVTPFQLWNDVSICNSEVISTSGLAAMLILTVRYISYILCIVALGVMSCLDIELIFRLGMMLLDLAKFLLLPVFDPNLGC